MSAFYSSTDNNNDRNGIYYSGVVGKLDTNNPQVVFRFNMHETKVECKIPDIFEIVSKDVTIPKEWMDQVEVKPAYVPTSKFSGNHKNQVSLWDNTINDIVKNSASYKSLLAKDLENHPHRSDIMGLMDEQIRELNEQAEQFLDEQAGTILVPAGYGLESDSDGDPVGSFSDEYEYYKGKYGVEVAEAKDDIDNGLNELSDCDEALVDIIRTAYSILGENGRADLGTNGM